MPRIMPFAKLLPKYQVTPKYGPWQLKYVVARVTEVLCYPQHLLLVKCTWCAEEKGVNGAGQGYRTSFLIVAGRGSRSFSISRALQSQIRWNLPFVTLQTCAFLRFWRHFKRTPLHPVETELHLPSRTNPFFFGDLYYLFKCDRFLPEITLTALLCVLSALLHQFPSYINSMPGFSIKLWSYNSDQQSWYGPLLHFFLVLLGWYEYLYFYVNDNQGSF